MTLAMTGSFVTARQQALQLSGGVLLSKLVCKTRLGAMLPSSATLASMTVCSRSFKPGRSNDGCPRLNCQGLAYCPCNSCLPALTWALQRPCRGKTKKHMIFCSHFTEMSLPSDACYSKFCQCWNTFWSSCPSAVLAEHMLALHAQYCHWQHTGCPCMLSMQRNERSGTHLPTFHSRTVSMAAWHKTSHAIQGVC